jgi:hypothetical protein
MPQAPLRDAFQLLDWIMSRHLHEYLDVAGRPVGEGRAAAFHHVQTDMQSCPYGGSRHHHAKPMNVSALRQILPEWEKIITMLSWLSQRHRARYRSEVRTYEDVLLVASAGVFLADFLVLRKHQPLRSREIPVVISGLYKVCLGFQLATFLGSMQQRFAGKTTPKQLPTAAEFHDYLEAQGLLIGEAEVCAGPPAMIMDAFDAMVGGPEVAREALPADCARLEIAWERHDLFTDHAAYLWNDLVMYVIEAGQFWPELADPRLPADVQERLNVRLKQHGAQLLAGQSGLVVDLARGAQQFIHCPPTPLPKEPRGLQSATLSLEPGSLAAAVLAWLSDVAGADVHAHARVVASALQAQLAPYEVYEATVLAGLNQHLNCLMDALGLGRPRDTLTPSALSHVCGRTLRDWGDPSR